MKEKFKITIKIEGEKQFKPHYTHVERVFEVNAPVVSMVKTIESMGKKFVKLYPLVELSTKNEKTNEEIAEKIVEENNNETKLR